MVLYLIMKQVELTVQYKGEKVALLEARKHAAWYTNGLRGAAQLRRRAGEIATLEDLARFCYEVIRADEEGRL